MIKFWIITVLLFVTVTSLFAKLTLKKSKKVRGEKMWKLYDGMTKYWLRVSLTSLAITACILYVFISFNLIILP